MSFLFNPAAYLLTWFLFAVAVQHFGWVALSIVFLGFLFFRNGLISAWVKLALRAKWLLLTLWMVLAYGTPGDLWHGNAFAPSIEGMQAASLHVCRLLLLLGGLALLFKKLTHEQFLVSLLVLSCPLRRLKLDAERTVARLGLVFNYLEQAPAKGNWRHFLDTDWKENQIQETFKLEVPRWRIADTFMLFGISLVLIVFLMLP